MRNQTILNKFFAVTMATAMSVGCALPAFAADASVTKDETVYVVLNGDGSVKSQTVSDHLHSDSGLAGVTDQSNLQNIQNTQSEATYTQNGTSLTWDTSDTDVYYKGDSTDTPPVTVGVTYKLDGTTVSAEDLAGKSGHLIVSVALTNNTMETVQVGTGESARTRTVCTPFAAVVGTMLDEDIYQNVTAEHGIVQSDGGSAIVGFVAMPGMKACLSDLLPSQLNNVNDYLMDVVTIEADVTDATAPNLMVAVAADANLLKDGSSEGILGDMDELDGLQDDLNKLTDAMDQLSDGTNQLNNGVGSLRTGANTLNSGASQLYAGICTLKSGTTQLRDGAYTLDNGMGSLVDGLNTLSGKNDTLNGSAQQLADGVLKLVNSALMSSGVITENMTWANYADVLSAAMGVNDEMRAQARAQIAASVQAQTGTALTEQQLNCLIYMTAIAMGRDGGDLNATVAAQGAKMNQAAADAAGSIAAGQTALGSAGNDPLAVPEVFAVMEKAALDSIYNQIGQGDNNALLLTMAVNSGNTDLTAALNEAGASAMAVLTAKGAIEAAGNNPAAVPEVQTVLLAMNPTTPGDAYTSLATALAGQGVTVPAQAALLITMAAQNFVASGNTDPSAMPAELGTAAAKATAVQTAQTDLATAAANGQVMTRNVKTLIDTVYVAQAYNTVAAQTGVTDPATNALLITMACLDVANGSQPDLSTALQKNGATLTNANEVQTAMTVANNGDAEAQSLIKSFLTSLVSTQSADSIKQISDLNALLSGEQALLAGLKAYTGGVATAAAGAATAKNGAAALASGAAQVDDGATNLQAGALQLSNGATTLYNGTGDLKNGTQKLVDGVNQLNDEGISKLTDNINADSLETLKNVAEEMKDRQDAYTGYSGTPENVTTSVKFVMKTGEAPAATTTTGADAEATATEAKTSLWQKILGLFGLGK